MTRPKIPKVSRVALIEALATGDTWEHVATLIGYTEKKSAARAAIMYGLKRLRIGDVIVIECKS